jgi:hypothetical protein
MTKGLERSCLSLHCNSERLPGPAVAGVQGASIIHGLQKGQRAKMMTGIEEQDLYNYFELFEQYQQTEDPVLVGELDQRLSQYKDRFHQNSAAVLKMLLEKRDSFIDRFEASYKDLLFDVQLHAESMDDIKRTHVYDSEREMWIPKEKKEG